MALRNFVYYRIPQGIQSVVEIVHRLVGHVPIFVLNVFVITKLLDQVKTAFGCVQLISPDNVYPYVN